MDDQGLGRGGHREGTPHCVVIDAEGRRLLSRRVANDEPELETLIADVAALGEEVTWTTDMAGGGAALLIGMLAAAGQRLLYLPGHTLAHSAGGDRTRVVNRMHGLLRSIFPALERELSLTSTGPLVLLTGYQAPAAIRRMGAARLQAWLRTRHARRAADLA